MSLGYTPAHVTDGRRCAADSGHQRLRLTGRAAARDGGCALAQQAKPAECEARCARHQPVRLSWARLLKRVFDLDLEHCPNCGGELRIIAAIREQSVIEKILMHLGLQDRAPPRAPARAQALRAA